MLPHTSRLGCVLLALWGPAGLAHAATEPAPPAPTAQTERAWYGQAALGLGRIRPQPLTLSLGGPLDVTLQGQAEYSARPAASLVLGREWPGSRVGWRAELELWSSGSVRRQVDVGVASLQPEDRVRHSGPFLNAALRLAHQPRWQLWLLAGVGSIRSSLPAAALPSGCQCFAEVSSTGRAHQLKLSLEASLSEHRAAVLQLGRVSLPTVITAPSAGPSTRWERARLDQVLLGMRQLF